MSFASVRTWLLAMLSPGALVDVPEGSIAPRQPDPRVTYDGRAARPRPLPAPAAAITLRQIVCTRTFLPLEATGEHRDARIRRRRHLRAATGTGRRRGPGVLSRPDRG